MTKWTSRFFSSADAGTEKFASAALIEVLARIACAIEEQNELARMNLEILKSNVHLLSD